MNAVRKISKIYLENLGHNQSININTYVINPLKTKPVCFIKGLSKHSPLRL
jgi:hypothetical protein